MKLGISLFSVLTLLCACGSTTDLTGTRGGPQSQDPYGRVTGNSPQSVGASRANAAGNEYNRNSGVYAGVFNGALSVMNAK